MLLEVKDLNLWYGSKHVLKGVSFELKEGEVLCLVGESGSGKSSILHAILGLLPEGTRLTGSIRFKGRELLGKIKEQIKGWGGVDMLEEEVVRVEKKGDVFEVESSYGKVFIADYVVLAGGFHNFNIRGLQVEVMDNPKSPKPGRVVIKHKDYEVDKNLFVVGTLAGLSSHFTSCAGSGVEVAVEILSRFAGKRIVIHDVPEQG